MGEAKARKLTQRKRKPKRYVASSGLRMTARTVLTSQQEGGLNEFCRGHFRGRGRHNTVRTDNGLLCDQVRGARFCMSPTFKHIRAAHACHDSWRMQMFGSCTCQQPCTRTHLENNTGCGSKICTAMRSEPDKSCIYIYIYIYIYICGD